MSEETMMDLLRIDLGRIGARPDDEYLLTLIRAAAKDIEREGIALPSSDVGQEDYMAMVVGTAAWMYTKRRTGEGMPRYVRSLRTRALLAQKSGAEGGASA